MEKETTGTVISVTKQWWLKVNRKPVRAHAMDGAAFPHTIKVKYTIFQYPAEPLNQELGLK